jgi:hypothetical protein
MPQPTEAPSQTPTEAPIPDVAPAPWPDVFTDPDTICPQQKREVISPDVAP